MNNLNNFNETTPESDHVRQLLHFKIENSHISHIHKTPGYVFKH